MWDHIQKYWLTYAMGIVAGGLGALWKWVRGKFKTLDAMKEANLALLHDRLYQGCKHYIAQGHIDVDSLKNIEYLYRAYHALGGNGTGTELYTGAKATHQGGLILWIFLYLGLEP